MDIASGPVTNVLSSPTNIKSPEPERDTPPPISIPKPLSFTNGILKRHRHPPLVFTYKECLKNHAATLGHHALDGCGEFMPPPSASDRPTTLKCAACGCHRNFHRKEPEEVAVPTTATIEYQPHHRHHPPPPPADCSPNSASPPPISSSYYPSAPRILLALSEKNPAAVTTNVNSPSSASPGSRKRFRTKFSQDQKDRMLEFADRVGWKMHKSDEDLVREFCNEVGIDKNVLKVWMHNNKNTFGKRDHLNNNNNNSTTVTPQINIINSNNNNENQNGTNNSSSSS